MYFQDLSACGYFGESYGQVLRAVGWLAGGHPFSVGTVSDEFYSKLKELLDHPWQPFIACGSHPCEICQFDPPMGINNLFIPTERGLFVCPELILHYIAAHRYLPPEEFIESVLRSPLTRTMEYKQLLLKSGGGLLLRGDS